MIQQSVQFSGLAHEDPNLHIANFLEICDTFEHSGVSDEAIRLRLFPFSLRDKAKVDTESLYEAWESEVRNMINAAAGGTLCKKTPKQAYELMEEMASNSYQWPIERLPVRRKLGVHNIDAITTLAAQMQALNKIDGLQMQKPAIVASMCDFCAKDHSNHECQSGNMITINSMPDQANYVSNFHKPNNNSHSATYKLGWRSHPNFSWSNNNQVKPPPLGFQSQEKKTNLEEMMAKFLSTTETII
ncbi:uncharacterized protein LOC116133741 [Pistacia vera]|uniref:uncharacterized protein LOC116133741 n=1 Tax=Pistacia vera TaxID=55513 RepID=UPI0012633FAB|nr:uncharacterized protein LOC116133741 [Pistacia vera]